MTILIKDPSTGTFSADPNGGRSIMDLTGTSAPQNTAPAGDPYSLFNKNVASMLTQIQNASVEGNQRLGATKDALTTASVTSAPYDPTMTPNANIGVISGMPSAFAPAVTSISTQQANTAAALTGLKDNLGTLSTIFQPRDVAPGSSLVTPGGTILIEGKSYSVVPDVTNPGTYKAVPTNTITQKNNSIVAGVDLSGQATSTGAYATDPNHAPAIASIYDTLSTTYPQPSADTIKTYIDGHAARSPVTGQMIMNAAKQYGVDANLLTALLAQESDFGTAGAATSTMNPGNVGNTDNGSRRTFGSWQAGVNAAANELARRKVPAGGGTTTQSSTSSLPVGAQADAYTADVVTGKRGYADAVDGMALYGAAGKVILDNAIRAAKPDFNFAQANTLAAQQGSIAPNLEYAQAALTNLSSATSNLSIWGQQSNIPILGGLANWYSMQSGQGKTQTSTKQGAVGEAQQAIASVLAAIKGGTPTEYGSQAKALLPDNPTPADIAAAQANLTALGTTKQGIYGTPGSSGTGGGTAKGTMSDRDYVEKTLSGKGMKYNDVIKKLPQGYIGAIDNATGALVQMLPTDFNASKYTHI